MGLAAMPAAAAAAVTLPQPAYASRKAVARVGVVFFAGIYGDSNRALHKVVALSH